MKAVAFEFLTKPFREQALLDAIQHAIEKDRARRHKLAAVAELRKRFETLTARAQEVMELVITGRLNKQIAACLDISEMPVKVHRGHVMRKMRAKSVVALLRIARKSVVWGKSVADR